MTLLIVTSFPSSCHFAPLMSKYFCWHPALKHPLYMDMAVFWPVAPCSLVEVNRRSRGDHRPDDRGSKHGATTQKTVAFILAVVKTSNLTHNPSS
jgi:hypothetical protein